MPGGILLRSSTLALLFSKFDANLPPTMVLFLICNIINSDIQGKVVNYYEKLGVL